MRVTPIRGAGAARLLCLSCRAVFGPTALIPSSRCPSCDGSRLLRLTGSLGPFQLLDVPAGASGPAATGQDADWRGATAVTLQWRNENQRGLAVLHLTGYLGESAIDRFAGAVGWVLARGSGPIVLDLADLHGWSNEGEIAVVDAAARLASHGRPLVVCGLHQIPEPRAAGSLGPPIAVYPDVGAALTELCAGRQAGAAIPSTPPSDASNGPSSSSSLN